MPSSYFEVSLKIIANQEELLHFWYKQFYGEKNVIVKHISRAANVTLLIETAMLNTVPLNFFMCLL